MRLSLVTAAVLVGSSLVATAAASRQLAGSAASQWASVQIVVSPAEALVDQSVDVRVTGLPRRRRLTLEASGRGFIGGRWRSRLSFESSRTGVVETRSNMKLFWSMRPMSKRSSFLWFPVALKGTRVTIRVLLHGHSLGSAVFLWRMAAAGVTWTDTALSTEGFVGTYFAPPPGPPGPAVLQLGGSEGGHGYLPAPVLASHGYPTLSLAYFKEPGLPRTLKDIPLEYFAKALRWLAAQPGVDPKRVIVLGVSRGGEAALLLGSTYPRLVHGVAAATPGSEVGGAWPPGGDAWTLGGRPVPYGPIPVWQIAGPVLATGGGKDPFLSKIFVQRILERAREHQRRDIVGRIYPNAGHAVGYALPNLPVAQYQITPGIFVPLGGTPAANDQAAALAWPRLLRFIRSLPQN